MMLVCLHDSFGMNYACDFAIHQMGKNRSSIQRNARDDSPRRTQKEMNPHSPLATGKSCDIHESGPPLSKARNARETTTNRRL
jgi:hypothetical protein